jgi:hypothetical protein
MSIRFEAIAGSIMLFLLLTLLGALNAESADYFPLSVGNRWVYSPSFGDKGDRVDSIIGSETINDILTFIWNRQEAPDDNYNEKRWIFKDSSYVKVCKIWGNEGIDPAIMLNPPLIIIALEPKVGDTWKWEVDIGSTHFKATFYVESVSDSLTVPAGTFRNCVKLRQLDEATENSITDTDYRRIWFAPNVGPIVYEKYTTNWGSVTISQRLIDFTVYRDREKTKATPGMPLLLLDE